MKYYTGVGTRQIPKTSEEYKLLVRIGEYLAQQGWTLRSGAADGADSAFEEGCDAASGGKEIYIAWNGFNSRYDDGVSVFAGVTKLAEDIAAQHHPAWDKCSQGAKKLHARNINQVFGQDLLTPSSFLVCYAPVSSDGTPKGGTRTAWVVAQQHNIPCYNVLNQRDKEALKQFLKGQR